MRRTPLKQSKPLKRTGFARKPVTRRVKRTVPATTGGWCSEKTYKALVAAVIERDGSWCRYCLVRLGPDEITLDHKRARSQGGSNEPSNIVIACKSCNSWKGAKGFAWAMENCAGRRKARKVTSYLGGR